MSNQSIKRWENWPECFFVTLSQPSRWTCWTWKQLGTGLNSQLVWCLCTRAVASLWSEATTSCGYTWRTWPANVPRSRWANDSWWWAAATVQRAQEFQGLDPEVEPQARGQSVWVWWLIKTAWWSSGGTFGRDVWGSSNAKRRRGSVAKHDEKAASIPTCPSVTQLHELRPPTCPPPSPFFAITGTLHITKTACIPYLF